MENNNFEEKKEKIIKGLELSYKKMVQFKRSKNSPLIVSENGKVIELDPFEASETTTYK